MLVKGAVFICLLLQRVLQALAAALQKEGHTVGFLGYGGNDVLAIRQADCGVAMASGCDAAQRVAKPVLMGNSFAS